MHVTTLKQIRDKLNSVDIGLEPIVFLHSSLFQLGKLDFGIEDLNSLLLEWVGPNGTLLMPSFSYQNTGDWYVSTSKAKTGALTEYFRRLPGVVRSIHPIHSVTAYGKYAGLFAEEMESSSFGVKSAFHKLIEMDAINVSLGANFIGGATFLHYAEEFVLVPFREFRQLDVKCYDVNNALIPLSFKYFARKVTAEGEFINDWDKPLSDFIKNELFTFDKVGVANFMYSRMSPAINFLVDELRLNPFYCSKFCKPAVSN
jgi:aminoglycoside 3-N-acetyltransferase